MRAFEFQQHNLDAIILTTLNIHPTQGGSDPSTKTTISTLLTPPLTAEESDTSPPCMTPGLQVPVTTARKSAVSAAKTGHRYSGLGSLSGGSDSLGKASTINNTEQGSKLANSGRNTHARTTVDTSSPQKQCRKSKQDGGDTAVMKADRRPWGTAKLKTPINGVGVFSINSSGPTPTASSPSVENNDTSSSGAKQQKGKERTKLAHITMCQGPQTPGLVNPSQKPRPSWQISPSPRAQKAAMRSPADPAEQKDLNRTIKLSQASLEPRDYNRPVPQKEPETIIIGSSPVDTEGSTKNSGSPAPGSNITDGQTAHDHENSADKEIPDQRFGINSIVSNSLGNSNTAKTNTDVPVMIREGLGHDFYKKLLQKSDWRNLLPELNEALKYFRFFLPESSADSTKAVFDEYLDDLQSKFVDLDYQFKFLLKHIGARCANGKVVTYPTWKKTGRSSFFGKPILLEYPDLLDSPEHLKDVSNTRRRQEPAAQGSTSAPSNGTKVRSLGDSLVANQKRIEAPGPVKDRLKLRGGNCRGTPEKEIPFSLPGSPSSQTGTNHPSPGKRPHTKNGERPVANQGSCDLSMESSAKSSTPLFGSHLFSTAPRKAPGDALAVRDAVQEELVRSVEQMVLDGQKAVRRHGLLNVSKEEIIAMPEKFDIIITECLQSLPEGSSLKVGPDIKDFLLFYWNDIIETAKICPPHQERPASSKKSSPGNPAVGHKLTISDSPKAAMPLMIVPATRKRKRSPRATPIIEDFLKTADMEPLRVKWRRDAQGEDYNEKNITSQPPVGCDEPTSGKDDPLMRRIIDLNEGEFALSQQLLALEKDCAERAREFERQRQELLISVESGERDPLAPYQIWDAYDVLDRQQRAAEASFRRQIGEIKERALLQSDERRVLVARWKRMNATLAEESGAAPDMPPIPSNTTPAVPPDATMDDNYLEQGDRVGSQFLRSMKAWAFLPPYIPNEEEQPPPLKRRKARKKRNW